MVSPRGDNYDVTHEDVVEQYKAWDEQYGLTLVGAGFDWIEARMSKPADDWRAFADEVYEICPDVVDQGTGDVDALAAEMQKVETLFLWWD